MLHTGRWARHAVTTTCIDAVQREIQHQKPSRGACVKRGGETRGPRRFAQVSVEMKRALRESRVGGYVAAGAPGVSSVIPRRMPAGCGGDHRVRRGESRRRRHHRQHRPRQREHRPRRSRRGRLGRLRRLRLVPPRR